MIKTIVFDFDGVIHDTFELHLRNINRFIDGEKLEAKEFKAAHEGNFNDSKQLIEKLRKIDFVSYRAAIYKEFIIQKIDEKIHNTLEILAKSHALFIITSGGERNINGYLKENNIQHLFKQTLGAETNKSKEIKLNIVSKDSGSSKEEILFVTDTLGDIREANNFGVQSVAVDFGYHTKETLEKGNPVQIISQFEDILSIVKELSEKV
jgi:phosphoglycolate phosphatase